MASCKSGQAIEKAQNGNGQLLEKVGMDLGLAPLPLGFAPHPLGLDATSAWGWLSSPQHREASGRRALSRDWPRLLPMLLSANFNRRRHGNDLRQR